MDGPRPDRRHGGGSQFAENGEAAGVPVDENGNVTIEGAGPDDLGNLYGDGSYQALTLTTRFSTRDGYGKIRTRPRRNACAGSVIPTYGYDAKSGVCGS